jgi:outer membrane lipoprotein-sorting protein
MGYNFKIFTSLREEMNLAIKHAIILIAAAFFLSACSSISGMSSRKSLRSEELYKAENLLLSMENKNSALKTFKGTGKIVFWKNNKKGFISSMAWAASVPDKIRIILRSLSGQPVVSLASDGEWVYCLSHSNRRFYKKPSNSSTLKKFISVPIKPADIFSILAGRIPVVDYDSITVKKNKENQEYIIVLKNNGSKSEKIYVDETMTNTRQIEIFNANGSLLYRAEFLRMQFVKNYQVPLKLFFSNPGGESLELNIDRYWPDVSVQPSTFVLVPPERSGNRK